MQASVPPEVDGGEGVQPDAGPEAGAGVGAGVAGAGSAKDALCPASTRIPNCRSEKEQSTAPKEAALEDANGNLIRSRNRVVEAG